jgi:NADH-quinone oxidoreductase subunit L
VTVPALAAAQTAAVVTGPARLVWLLPVLPLAGFVVGILFGRRLRGAAGWIATLLVFASFGLAVAALADLARLPEDGRTVIVHGYQWFAGVAFDLRFDPLSATLALIITGIGGLIHLYSIGYMAGDDRRGTYFAYLNLFVAAMLVLVLGQNFLVTFLGWEGVGLCSYLLIGFWYNRRLETVVPSVDGAPDHRFEVSAPAAAKKAFVANRVGDVGFLLAMFLIFTKVGSLDYDRVFDAANFGPGAALAGGVATAVALLLFLACTGKSAQIPLFTWLPDAMAGPTPVSALIHAATMVTAGVFLIARTHVIFEASPAAGATVTLIGAATALLAALIAVAQDDIKRILAYSTVSQLGYMFLAVGLGPIGYVAAIFHLLTHAFFKAQLFLGAGSVMHANDEDTDVKNFGALARAMRVTWITMAVSWLAIIGIIPFSGYWSKEQVLFSAIAHGGVGTLAWVVGFVTAGITAFYMSRLFFLTFHGTARWPEGRHPHESPPIMTVPLVVLAVGAAVAGAFNLSEDGGVLARFLHPVFFAAGEEAPSTAGAPPGWLLSVLTVGLAVVAAAFAWSVYGAERFSWKALRARWAGLYLALAEKLHVDEAYEWLTVRVGGKLADLLAGPVERGLDGTVTGVGTGIGILAGRWRRLQNGLVRSYAVGVLAGAVLLLAFLIFQGIR